jgi:hypothetical protein
MPKGWRLDLVGNGFVSIGWDEMGGLSAIGYDKDVVRAKLTSMCPDMKPSAVPGTAGTLLAFSH